MASSFEKILFSGISIDKRKHEKFIKLFETEETGKQESSSQKLKSVDRNSTDEEPNHHRLVKRVKIQPKTDNVGDIKIFKDIIPDDVVDNPLSPKVRPVEEKKRMAEEEASAILRKRCKIHVTGQNLPPPLAGFDDLISRYGCRPSLLSNIRAAGYTEPTPIQRQAIPLILTGRECFACAPTGSGKTMAFLIPIIASLKVPSKDGIRATILCPTRELALQTGRELKKLTKGKKFRIRLMTKSAANCTDLTDCPCDVLISTPLRLSHVIESKKIDLSKVSHLVLDESDKLFEMGFVEQIDSVIAACSNPSIIRCLFSATLPETVEELARSVMPDPIRVVIGERNSASASVEQGLTFVGSEEGKLLAIRQMFQKGLNPPVLIFVQSKERAKQLNQELHFDGYKVDSIHADKTNAQREDVVERFREGKIWVLICTDVMSRGIDFKGVNCVINYDFPQSTAAYVHRIGRSGRAGRSGKAITFYTEEDVPLLKSVANVMAASGADVPAWIMNLKKQRLRGVKKIHVPRRKDISTAPVAMKRGGGKSWKELKGGRTSSKKAESAVTE